MDTEGRTRLVEYLDKTTQAALAEAVGTSQTNVSAWARGVARPGDEYREALEIVAGIPADAWRTDEERGKVERARAHVARLARTGTEG